MSNTKQISSKIMSYRVVTDKDTTPPSPELETLHEGIERPAVLFGSTYKIKTPQSEHALYVTINDVILNLDTEFEERRCFEMFVNCKNPESFQWVTALTRVISASFRKGGEINYLVDELKAVFDPAGGFWEKGTFYPSLIARIGAVLEAHLKSIGAISTEPMPQYKKDFIEAKRAEFEANNEVVNEGEEFPKNATLCHVCHKKAVVLLDGCRCCLSCGFSQCG